MAYKFQLGDARLSGSLIQEGSIQTSGDITPLNADGAALGSTTKEWSDLYLADNGQIYLGSDQDASIKYDPSAGYPGTSDGAILASAGQFELRNSDNNRPYLLVTDTSNDAISGQIILFKDRSSNAADNDELGILNFAGRDSGGNALAYANITGRSVDVTDGSEDGGLLFNARVNGGHPKENLMDINYTLASGVNVKYDLQVGDDIFLKSDSAAIHFGADSEVKLEHEHNDGVTLISSVASKPVLRIKNTNDDANGAKLRIVKDTSNSAANNDVLGIIDFTGEDSGNAGHVYASMTVKSRVVNAGSEEGAIIFAVVDGGSDETNLLDINNTLDGGVTVANDLQVGDDIFMKSDSAAIHFGADSEVVLEHQHNDGLTLSSAVSDKPVLRMGNTNADATGPLLRFFKSPSDDSSANADVLGQIDFRGEDAGDSSHTYVRITAKSRDVSSGAEHGALIFELGDGTGAGAGTGDPATLMDINSSLAKGVSIAHGLDVNGHDGSSEGLRLNGTLVTTTAAELNLLDGGTAVGSSITLADSDGVLVDDAGTMKKIPASDFKTYLADNSLNVALKDNTNTLSNGVNYFADLSGAEAVNLPASPDVGDNVYVKAPSNCSSTNTLTINRQGSHTIDGEASIVLESPHAAVMLVYVVANTWKVF